MTRGEAIVALLVLSKPKRMKPVTSRISADFPATLEELIRMYLAAPLTASDRFRAVNALRDIIHQVSPNEAQPVDRVRWVPLEMVTPNDYNPNSVAIKEMGLLLRSIDHDGYTQPVVTVWNPDRVLECRRCKGKGDASGAQVFPAIEACPACEGHGSFTGCFEIVDGFHRFFVMSTYPEIRERCHGHLPVVVLNKQINDRMASTVRHNRARGKHSVDGMSNMVFQMLENGMSDEDICNELGMEAEELVRLKHITGFAKLFEDVQYNRAWVTKAQARLKLAREKAAEADKAAAAEAGTVAAGTGSAVGDPADEDDGDDDRTCRQCGDVCVTLSSDNLCDGCVLEEGESGD